MPRLAAADARLRTIAAVGEDMDAETETTADGGKYWVLNRSLQHVSSVPCKDGLDGRDLTGA